jgi:predicted enzyme related to lactoylglutathione lyase
MERGAVGSRQPIKETTMFKDTDTFSSFSVDDVPAAKEFYDKTLGLDVTEVDGMLFLKLGGGGTVVVYPKGEAHEPASFTVLSFQVQDINATVDELKSKGATFQRYDGFEQDERGIAKDKMGAIAWFTDPARNVFAVLTRS